jgi:hypothetical protein
MNFEARHGRRLSKAYVHANQSSPTCSAQGTHVWQDDVQAGDELCKVRALAIACLRWMLANSKVKSTHRCAAVLAMAYLARLFVQDHVDLLSLFSQGTHRSAVLHGES